MSIASCSEIFKTCVFGGYEIYFMDGITSSFSDGAFKRIPNSVSHQNPALEQTKDALAEEYGMGGTVDLIIGPCYPLAQSKGSAIFHTFKKTIYLDRRLAAIDPEAASWAIRHQMCVLKENVHLRYRLAALVPSAFCLWFLPFPLAALGSVGFHVLFNKEYNTLKGDAAELSFQHATAQELEGAVRLFTAEIFATAVVEAKLKTGKVFKFLLPSNSNNFVQVSGAVAALINRFHYTPENIGLIIQDQRIIQLRDRILFE
jgi:hypothetical protein